MERLQKAVEAMAQKKIPMDLNCTFAQLTTVKCGGKIFLTLFPENKSQLIFVAKYLFRHKLLHIFLGHGSNVVASEKDYPGVVVVTSRVKDLLFLGQTVVASCGVSTSKLCSKLIKIGLSDGEFFGCLPATVGGATVCNAGCFGQSVQNVVKSVTVFHKGRILRYNNTQCRFQKRSSIFKNNADFLVLSVTMKFQKDNVFKIRQTMEEMRQKKVQTQPLNSRSAGCVLYDEKVAVSKLVDSLGLKGFRMGGAQVSEKHAGFVINLDKATGEDIYLLVQYIQNSVKEKFGVNAKTEVCFVNF